MAVPARNVRRIETCKTARFDDDIFQDFIDGVSDMDVAVGVWRAVMQNELGTADGRFSDPLINFLVLPLFDPVGFPFCKVAAHREGVSGIIDRIFFTLFVFVLFAGLVRRFVRHFYHTIWFTTE